MHTKLSNDEKIQIATLVKEVWRKTNEEEKKIFLRKLLKLTNIAELIDRFLEEEIIDEVYFKYGKVVGSIWAKKALDDKIEHTLGLDPTVCCVGHQSVMPKGKVNSILGFRKDVDAIDDWELSYFLGWATGARKIIDRINGMCF